MMSWAPEASKRVRDSHCSHCEESHKKTKLQNCNICMVPRSGFLVVNSVSVSSSEPRLPDFVSSLMSLTSLAFLQDSMNFT